MKLALNSALVFVPDGQPEEMALRRTTHMGIGAHQDDLEIMAAAGIFACFQHPEMWFTGVVTTNGSGSPRSGPYAQYDDAQMRKIRRAEQIKAAVVGEYTCIVQLDYPSSRVKSNLDRGPVEDLKLLLTAAKPGVIYTHNPIDKHPTHVATALRVIMACRELAHDGWAPDQFIGCEVWRDLDWLPDDHKIRMDISGHDNLQWAMLGVYDSQVCGGKRYDQATMGRRHANATYDESHGVDTSTGLAFGLDLMPLLRDPNLQPGQFIAPIINQFATEACTLVNALY